MQVSTSRTLWWPTSAALVTRSPTLAPRATIGSITPITAPQSHVRWSTHPTTSASQWFRHRHCHRSQQGPGRPGGNVPRLHQRPPGQAAQRRQRAVPRGTAHRPASRPRHGRGVPVHLVRGRSSHREGRETDPPRRARLSGERRDRSESEVSNPSVTANYADRTTGSAGSAPRADRLG